jgi:hypothetical protein
MLRTVAPSERSLIGAFAVPERFIVTSVSVRSWPVKHTEVPGEAASRAAATSPARVTVRLQLGARPWFGPAEGFGLDDGL